MLSPHSLRYARFDRASTANGTQSRAAFDRMITVDGAACEQIAPASCPGQQFCCKAEQCVMFYKPCGRESSYVGQCRSSLPRLWPQSYRDSIRLTPGAGRLTRTITT